MFLIQAPVQALLETMFKLAKGAKFDSYIIDKFNFKKACWKVWYLSDIIIELIIKQRGSFYTYSIKRSIRKEICTYHSAYLTDIAHAFFEQSFDMPQFFIN